MAKKEKKIVINDQELTPTVLATVNDKKKVSIFGLIWLVIIFSVFGIGIYFLPDIAIYVNNYLNPEPKINSKTPEKEKEPEKEQNAPVKETDYSLTKELEIVEDAFKLNNIKVENNIISFNIINTSNSLLDLSKYNYFINLSDSNKKLLQRIWVNEGLIPANSSNTLSYNTINDSISYISLINLKTSDYPAYNVSKDENGNGNLVCTMNHETIEYIMTNNKLLAINDSYNISLSDPNYSNLSGTYYALAEAYNAIEGVTSTINEENNMLNFKTIINLTYYTDGAISKKTIYKQNTDAKIIKFELEASGYTCK